MMNRVASALTVVGLVVLCYGTVVADFQRSISYQGRVTDGSANPVNNPAGSFVFRLFDAPVGGAQVWSESVVLTVEDGLFAHDLGSTCDLCRIPDNVLFDDDSLWLEVQYETEVMTPRTRLTASPYAYRVASVDKSTGGTITGEVVVNGNSIGNQLQVSNTGFGRAAQLQNSSATNTEAALQVNHSGSGPAGSFFSESGPGLRSTSTIGDAAEFDGSVDINGGFRNLQFRNNSDLVRAEMGLGPDGGEMVLYSTSGVDAIVMNGGVFGDASVSFPANAVQSFEMLDEPGLANAEDLTSTSISGTSFTTVTTRSIDVPADGYVLAMATGSFNLPHTTGFIENATVRITDFTSSADVTLAFSAAAPTGQYRMPFAVQGIWQVTPGVKSFSLRANEDFDTFAGQIYDARLVLLYIPTAYGTIVPTSPAVLPDDPALMGGDGEDNPATASEITRLRLEREVAQLRRQVNDILSRMDQAQK